MKKLDTMKYFSLGKKPNLNALALAKGLQQIGDLLPFASSCYLSCTHSCTLKIN